MNLLCWQASTHTQDRFHFARLPFGLTCAQDIFQRMMDQILDHCEGVIGIADDIIIHGKDDAEHDRRLHKSMKVTREHGLVLNKKKCEVKSNSVNFFSCVYNKYRAHPDPPKVSAIKEMPAPQNKRRASELPWNGNISLTILPITIFSHSNTQRTSEDQCWIQLEHYISSHIWQTQIIGSEDTTLRYFNTKKPVTIQVNASGQGLGATLIQDDGPVAFTSKVLTPTEQCYANNERELLACIFGAERFWTYVFGRHFTIESDHKSLEQISMKNLASSMPSENVTHLADAPVCIQRCPVCLWLQDYDFTIKYHSREEMVIVVIADTLLRYSIEDTPEILLDISVNHVYIDAEKKQDYQLAIKDDPLLHALADTIITGWPDNIKDVAKALWPYHGQCDSLTVEDGLILHGEAIIIPPGERKKVLEQIHQGHLGTSKCQYRARQCIYWPGINKDIKQQVEACPTCQRHRPQATTEANTTT